MLTLTVLISMVPVFQPDIFGQEDKTKEGQPDVQIDDFFFNKPPGTGHHFHMFPYHGRVVPESEDDSLYGYIHPGDSVYYFNEPDDFFERFHHRHHFNDSLFDPFFSDPNFGHDPFWWPDFDMRSMMENHRKMLEEMHRFFEFDMPCYPLKPDSIPKKHMQQRYHPHSKSIPKVQEI